MQAVVPSVLWLAFVLVALPGVVVGQVTVQFPRSALTNDNTISVPNYFGDPQTFPIYPLFDRVTTTDAQNKGFIGSAAGIYDSVDGLAYDEAPTTLANYKGDWVMINLVELVALTQVKFYCRTNFCQRAPRRFRIYGTNDVSLFSSSPTWDSRWTTVHDQTTSLSGYADGTAMSVNIANNNRAFSIYVLAVNRIGTGSGADTLNMGEWEIFGTAGVDCPAGQTTLDGGATCTPFTVTRPCSPGSFLFNGNCFACGAGTFSSTADATSCTNCPAGTYSSTTGAAA